MKVFITTTALTLAILAFGPAAGATEFVPPENSAATQYTEAFPTGGGNQDAEKSGAGHRSPAEALGASNAHRLQNQGRDGQATAELASATAPSQSTRMTLSEALNPHSQGRHGRDGSTPSQSADSEEPNVNSGPGEVVGQATGASSSSDIGWLLPLVIGAATAWSLAFFWRRRRSTT